MNRGAVLILDNDTDDREFLEDAWKELNYPNKLLFFDDGQEVLDYLYSGNEIPFLVLSEINFHGMDGFALKEKFMEDSSMNYRTIPFVIWSTVISKSQIKKAYDLGVNGIFIKEESLEALKKSLIEIVNYWLKCVVPD